MVPAYPVRAIIVNDAVWKWLKWTVRFLARILRQTQKDGSSSDSIQSIVRDGHKLVRPTKVHRHISRQDARQSLIRGSTQRRQLRTRVRNDVRYKGFWVSWRRRRRRRLDNRAQVIILIVVICLHRLYRARTAAAGVTVQETRQCHP